jgi:hypothetical protein
MRTFLGKLPPLLCALIATGSAAQVVAEPAAARPNHLKESKSPLALTEKLGICVSRYGLVLTLFLIGVLMFTAEEAPGIQPLVANRPLMFWLYRIFSVQAVSNLIGAAEIAVALLIALRPVSARFSFVLDCCGGTKWRSCALGCFTRLSTKARGCEGTHPVLSNGRRNSA